MRNQQRETCLAILLTVILSVVSFSDVLNRNSHEPSDCARQNGTCSAPATGTKAYTQAESVSVVNVTPMNQAVDNRSNDDRLDPQDGFSAGERQQPL